MQVDDAYVIRVRRALSAALLRSNAATLVLFAGLAAVMCVLAATGGDWLLAGVSVALAGLLPVFLWRSATRLTARTPRGTLVAYAVTPDGTFHTSTVAGTLTVNPGFVGRVGLVGGCWLVTAPAGVVVVPKELLPDADAALLSRHAAQVARPARPGR